MNSDRWNRIEVLYNSALQLEAADRETFLEQQSQGDESLKDEVLSLLASANRQDSFMEEPAATLALEVLRSERMGLIGETVARYQIVDVLGHGGMGEVYLAHDPSLNRKVALKLLPVTITDNQLRVARFQQEARAASAIAHPNVAHIYEIGEANGLHYITMEYVKGSTLRELLKTDALEEAKALDISKQVCLALAAAHKAGVIHRDIKPENIVVTGDGHVKVLDFGLAKLIEGVRDETEFHGTSSLHTQPELLMGTWQYMSPEQVRRQPVDCRTDLWSLGVVLFELLFRRRPFPGDTTSEIIVAILEREPDSGAMSKLLSREMTAVLPKLLSKDPDARYQSAEELLHDLRQIDADALTTEILRPITVGERIDTIPGQTQKTPERVVSGTFRKLSLIVPVFLIAAAAFYYVFKTAHNNTLLDGAFNLRFERLHLSGDITEIVISPDGQYVAYSVVEAGKHSIHARELATGSDLRVTALSDASYSGLSFSPDGTFVYYLENQAETGTLYRVSKLGGQRRILENVNTAVTFSPDGSRMAFVRSNNAVDPADLVIAPADGGSSSVLVRRTLANDRFFSSHMQGPGPAWSPDGKSIACVTHGLGPKRTEVSLEVVDVESGTARAIKAGPWRYISRISWLADGSGMIVAATETPGGSGQLYLVGDRATHQRQITNDPNNYTLVSGSSDSRVFVTRNVERSSSIWHVSLAGSPGSSPAVTSVEQRKGLSEVERGTEGRFIYSVFDGKNINLWLQDGSGTRQLTFEADNSKPTMSPDGRYIVFCSTRAGMMNIWRMNSDGTEPLQLTNGSYEDLPSVTVDGKWVIYRTGKDTRKVSIDGGPPVILLSREVQGPSLSPDGRLLAFFVNDQPDSQVWHLEIYDLTLSTIVKRFALPDATLPFHGMSLTPDNRLRWTPDGTGLAYVSSASGASNIWLQPLNGGQFRKLTDFKEAEITSFAWSDDGRQVVLVRDTRAYVPVLVRLF
ncbi:MAG TPA: protein kinase [Pyrinomonadaceae bacterium]|nr:protein kinase [Pyrinomonadaceae bacterium]